MSTEKLLAERQTTHGEYADHAACTQDTMRVWQSYQNWDRLPDIIKETLHMIAHKVGRVLTGNEYVVDHYDDIAGYAKLVSQRIVDKVGLKPEYVREQRAAAPEDALVSLPDANIYEFVAEKLGCSVKEAKDRVFGSLYGQTVHKEPTHPGTPEDGGHHARQSDPGDEDVLPSPPMTLSELDMGTDTIFRFRHGARYGKLINYNDADKQYPWLVREVELVRDNDGNITGYEASGLRSYSVTAGGKVFNNADNDLDLVERIIVNG